MPFTDLSLTHCLAKTTEFLQKRSNIANLTCLQLFTHSTNHHKLQIPRYTLVHVLLGSVMVTGSPRIRLLGWGFRLLPGKNVFGSSTELN